MGSISMAEAFRSLPSPAYKISKAALNMLTVQYAKKYEDDGFTFLAVSPGVSKIFLPFFVLPGAYFSKSY